MELMKQFREGELAALPDGEVDGGVAPEGFAERFRGTAGEDDEGIRPGPLGLPGGVEAAVLGLAGDGASVDHGDIGRGAERHRLIARRVKSRRHCRRLGLVETATDGLE